MEQIKDIIFKKYKFQVLLMACAFVLILIVQVFHFMNLDKKEDPTHQSIAELVPKGFVLIPVEISNGKDIIPIIGPYGVVDLYAYSKNKDVPDIKVGMYIKVIAPDSEESSFMALIPEKEVNKLFEHSPPFYAVIQNPKEQKTKIYKKKKTGLIVVEEKI